MKDAGMIFPEGYRVVCQYLNDIYDQTHDDTLGSLLGGMSLLPDGTPADPAYTEDWNNAVNHAMQGYETVGFEVDLAYDAGIWFLEGWLALGWRLSTAEVHNKRLWADLSDDNQAPVCRVVRDMIERKRMDLWEKSVKDVSADMDNPYLRLINERRRIYGPK